jgi:hypothetical protein
MLIVVAKKAFNRKILLLTSELNMLNSGRNWFGVMFRQLLNIWPRKLEQKDLENFKLCCWRRMEKIKWPENVTNEEVP